MDASLIEELITENKTSKIEAASEPVFEVPRRDFVSFSTRKCLASDTDALRSVPSVVCVEQTRAGWMKFSNQKLNKSRGGKVERLVNLISTL